MNQYQDIKIDDYNYSLPDERIAKYPLEERDQSKLLIMRDKNISHTTFNNIYNYLPNDSLLVFNNTRVINARMHFKKETGALIEIFCLEPINPIDYSVSLGSNKSCTWKCLVGNNKKWKSGKLSKKLDINGESLVLQISKLQQVGNAFEINFEWDNNNIHFSDILENSGNIPIPPYLNRESQDIDKSRYQTIYSELNGSVAAPTAGLHFTESVLQELENKNIKTESVTLHVGAGTFHPVKTDKVAEHEMHTEHFIITQKNIESLIKHRGNITVVGTTSVRTLESLFVVANQINSNPDKQDKVFFVSQWEAYEIDENICTVALLKNLLKWMQDNEFEFLNCSTQIMIVPGYKFKLTNRLITNFHQPKSTLLLLLSAFIGNSWRDVYDYAMNNDFRFLSYGDSSLFFGE